jgi:tRNA (cmo5U34)-methyltransferase
VGRKPQKLAIPKEWTFRTPAVAKAFDSHVREQLPWYDLATGIVAHVARCYVPQNGVVVDVGASTGNVGRAIAKTLKDRSARLIAIDAEASMKDVYDAPGDFVVANAERYGFANASPDVIVCFLSMMFVPVALRPGLLEYMYGSLRPGGALIVFDKTVPKPGYVGTVAYRLALAAKYENGASPEEIIAKELSLSGVQRPLEEGELKDFVEVFRFGDFAGFVRET